MIKRQPLRDAPEALKELFEELQASGDYLVFENDQHQPVLSVAPLADVAKARRLRGARKLRKLLAELPPNPYSEEETNALIEDAIEATKGQYPDDARVAT